MQVLRQFEAARHADGPVRDHRPLCLNLDDHIRVCSVVKGKGNNFRSLPGVVTHEDGQLMCSTYCLCIGGVVAVVVVVAAVVIVVGGVVVVVVVVGPEGKCLTSRTCEATDWCAMGRRMTGATLACMHLKPWAHPFRQHEGVQEQMYACMNERKEGTNECCLGQ